MTDFFALLQEPRLPCGNADLLKKKFLDLSMALHPDRFHQASTEERAAAAERYVRLTQACQCLSNPKDRLRHFLELERAKPLDSFAPIDPAEAESFSKLASTFRQAQAFLSSRRQTESPLLQAQQYSQALDWIGQIQALAQAARTRLDALWAQARKLAEQWPRPEADRPRLLERFEAVYRSLAYAERWIEQLDELALRLGDPGG